MNTMTHALVNAGIQVPSLSRRVWHMIRDQGEMNCSQLSRISGEPMQRVSDVCGKMVKRGMLKARYIEVRGRTGKGWGVRQVTHYSIPSNMKAYELLPMPKETRPVQAPTQAPTTKPVELPIQFVHAEVTVPVDDTPRIQETLPVADQHPLEAVGHLTLNKLRALNRALDKLFGGMA